MLTPKGLLKTFGGDDYDVWAIKVSNLLKLQDLWHFIVKEDPRDPDSFKALMCSKKKEGKLLPYVSYKKV